jgi:trk system potassium uptake protein TrkA
MNILIVGCGDVGSRLATTLSLKGHDVSVIDRDTDAFAQLGDDFTGLTVSGVPIDQDVLRRAGIEGCDAVAAMTTNDNINIMVSQIAREIFKVPKVLTRIYDPKRDVVYSQFGLHTVCPTTLTVNSVISMLTDQQDIRYLNFDASSTLAFSTVTVDPKHDGLSLSLIPVPEDQTLLGLLHADGHFSLLGEKETLTVRRGDRLILAKPL